MVTVWVTIIGDIIVNSHKCKGSSKLVFERHKDMNGLSVAVCHSMTLIHMTFVLKI
jgi:hypothetical protein